MDEHIGRALTNQQPASARRADCRREIGLAVVAIRAVVFTATKRQLESAAKKLTAAHQALEELGPPFNSGEHARHVRWLGQFGQLLDKLAVIEKGRGRERAIAYRRKYTAAKQAFKLLLQWRPRQPPTLDGKGDFFELTAGLYEAATGEEAGGEVDTACKQVISDAKEEGYQPDKPAQFLEHVRASQDFFWSEVERLKPGVRREMQDERLREVDRLLAAKHN
jgi:hypothetical protein